MNQDAELIEREKRFWTAAVDYYEQWLAADALMVFPAPVGILDREKALAGLRSGSRWTSIKMEDHSISRVGSSTAVLAYRAIARKSETDPEYRALIGSVYIQDSTGWKLAFHQHTPVQAD
jgi:hypothetical protein